MPRDPSLPTDRYLLCALPNITRRVKQEESTRRIRSGPQSVHRGKPARPETIYPMLDFKMVTTFSAGVVVI